MDKIISINEKKIVRWGTGLVVFLTKEIKRFGWSDKNLVKISAIESKEGNRIVIEKVK